MEMRAGYKQTELGIFPQDWVETSLGSLATFRTGPFGSALHKSDYVIQGVPVVNPMQIVDGKIIPTPSMTISDDAARKLSEFRLTSGEVVIGRRGDMGRCALVGDREDGWLCGTGSMIVRPKSDLSAEFAQRVLSSRPVIRAIESSSVGTTMTNLNQGTLANLKIVVPPSRAEQEAMGATLSGDRVAQHGAVAVVHKHVRAASVEDRRHHHEARDVEERGAHQQPRVDCQLLHAVQNEVLSEDRSFGEDCPVGSAAEGRRVHDQQGALGVRARQRQRLDRCDIGAGQR